MQPFLALADTYCPWAELEHGKESTVFIDLLLPVGPVIKVVLAELQSRADSDNCQRVERRVLYDLAVESEEA